MKVLSVSNMTNRYLWPHMEVIGYRPGRSVAMRFWKSLSDVVLMISTVTCRVRLTGALGLGGSLVALSGGSRDERTCFCNICICPLVVWTDFWRRRAAF